MVLLTDRQIHIFRKVKDILEGNGIKYKASILENRFVFFISNSPSLVSVFEMLDLISEKIILQQED